MEHTILNHSQLITWYILAVLYILHSTKLYALESDRNLPIQCSADSMQLKLKQHRIQCQGNVQITQGTTHVQAAAMIIHSDANNKLISAVAKGNTTQPAHYWTITDTQKPELHAYADVINYLPKHNLIELIGHARIEQDDNKYSAPTIKINSLTHTVISHTNSPDLIHITLNNQV